ncbi:hypothetical protein RvY_10097 [Ramazzottius varieornatus]|uniref:Trafficking protein particle complex subunit 12 n=1 Tax=Ramazzottius varieornatus TaxID=947166 RepID=A0A1D1VBL6_RAMVA|nr:hypothetical protein RvY_10097 [Ramazzottius varieornatus]
MDPTFAAGRNAPLANFTNIQVMDAPVIPPAGALGDALNTGVIRNTSSTVMQNSPLEQYGAVTAGDYSRPGDPVKQFSIGVVDETAGDLTPSNSNFSSQRSRSNTPSTVSVGIPSVYFPSAASYGSFELLVPQELAKNVGMESLFSDEDSNVPFSIRSAWIPNERTSAALRALADSVPASDFLGADQITNVGVFSDRLFANPAFDLALKLVGTIPQSLLAISPDVMIGNNDVRSLVAQGFYSSAANVSAKLLGLIDQGFHRSGNSSRHTPESLKIWQLRIASLFMLQQYEQASKELEPFGDLDNPDLYLEFHRASFGDASSGSMVPSQLRLLHACLPAKLGNPKNSLERLFSSRNKIEALLNNALDGRLPAGVAQGNSHQFHSYWQEQRAKTLYQIVAVGITSENFEVAISTIKLLQKLLPSKAELLWHQCGLLYCHIGSYRLGRICFGKADSFSSGTLQNYSVLARKAILMLCEHSPVHALEIYKEMHQRFPHDAPAANGVAVGYFYSGRMSESMAFLEDLVFNKPKVFLTEQSIANLVGLYELQSIQVRQRKLRLLSLICQHIPDGAFVRQLRLTET